MLPNQPTKSYFPLIPFFFFNDALLYGVGRVGNLDFDEDIGIYVTFISQKTGSENLVSRD